ncbi:conserved Plasmodium protein, unknown function [Plasmodium gallinaceum]|uniref:A-kinase anchor protein 7-like phosphoesterase domain-containing protein n=1 Tax=Plasmodium gallinaceum TaxID=5849 RepID=A0A1J1H0D3_PLAGA|nr:conserved Plasmodium protein, unknown function [Plasmodium gallinaceum]CRG97907.1 conserved Plasmodium protein, unknown function [Plasmodium gallinaceum]
MNIKKSICKYLNFYYIFIKSDHNNKKFHFIRENTKMTTIKPNYFICIPLNNEVICNELVKIQNHIVMKYDKLKECSIEKNKFHISLLILYIKKSQIELSKEAFHEAMDEIKKIEHEKILFDKLDTFRNDVLYLSLKESSNDYIINMINVLKKSFEKRDIKIIYNKTKNKNNEKQKKNDNKNEIKNNLDKSDINKDNPIKNNINKNSNDTEKITPHLTIMKNSYMKKIYVNRKPQIFADYYSDFNLTNLLKEHFVANKIQFLEMNIDSFTSYYKILSECNLL